LKTMGLPKLGSWLALRSQRSELPNAVKGGQASSSVATVSRPPSSAGSISVTEQRSPWASPPGTFQRTSGKGVHENDCQVPLVSRTPLHFAQTPTPTRAGACPARSVSLTRSSTPVKANTVCGSRCVRPLPQKPTFCPPGCTVSASGSATYCLPPRSASAIKVRSQEFVVGVTPRSSSCTRTRIEFSHLPIYSSMTASAAPPPIVSSAPVASVVARPEVHPLGIHVTIRPLSPSSGRIRQAPACRRVPRRRQLVG